MTRRGDVEFDVGQYWEGRYHEGGTSGKGSYGRLADFKAEVINGLLAEIAPQSIIELGCGDGNQLSLMERPKRYVGLDISPSAVALCRSRFEGIPGYEFEVTDQFSPDEKFDLAMSLDVIFHLVTDDVFDAYMRRLVGHAKSYILVYSSNFDEKTKDVHVRHRRFQTWLELHAPQFKFLRHTPNRYPRRPFLRKERSFADFYLFQNTPID